MSASSRSPRARRRLRSATVGVALACALGLVAPALAAAPDAVAAPAMVPGSADPHRAKVRVDQQIEALKSQLDETSVGLQNAFIALHLTQAAMPGAQQALDQATAALGAANAYNDEMAMQLQVAQANEARAVDQLAATRHDIVTSRTRVARFAAQIYQDQGMGQLSVALNATTPDDFANRIAMTDTVMEVQNQSLGRLATAQAAATAQEAHLSALQTQVAAAKQAAQTALTKAQAAQANAVAAKAHLDTLLAQQTAQSQALAAQAAVEKRNLDAAQVVQQHLENVLAAMARAAKIAAAKRDAALRRAGQSVPAGPSGTGFLSPPSDGWISSEFGMRFHPILHYWRLHAGRDYAANCGTPIRAAAPGRIISAGWAGGYGNRIMVDHGIIRGVDLVTTYNHMSRMAVTSGYVTRGEVIGYVGTSGESTGCHLHFETYEDGIPKDPRRWL